MSKRAFLFCCCYLWGTASPAQVDSIEYFFEKGKAYAESNQPDSVRYIESQLFRLCDNPTHYNRIIDFYVHSGHMFESRGDFEVSIEEYRKGRELAVKYDDPLQVSYMFVEISQSYRIFHDYEKSVEYSKMGYEVVKKDSAKYPYAIMRTLGAIGSGFTEMGELDSGLYYEERVMSFLSVFDSSELRTPMVNYGHTLMESGRLEEARFWTEQGLRHYLADGDAYTIGSIYTNLAMYGNRANKLHYSLRMFDSAIHYSEKSRYIETFFWIYEERAEVYQKLGWHDKALADLEALLYIKDSVFRVQRDLTTQEMEARFQTAEKEKQIAIQKATIETNIAELRFNRALIAGLVMGVILLAAVAFLVRYRMRLKQTQLIAEERNLAKQAQISAGIQSQEKERNRFAKDLHDNMGQLISVMNMSMDKLKSSSDLDKEDLDQTYDQCSETLAEMYKEVKNVCFDLMPQSLKSGGLIVGLQELIHRINALGKVKIELITLGGEEYSDDIALSQYRIAQEWLNNVLKYSDATNITVQAIQDEEEILLMIEDDGKGFNTNGLSSESGYGWKNIQSRADFVKGIIDVDSHPERRGTSFTLTISRKNIESAI